MKTFRWAGWREAGWAMRMLDPLEQQMRAFVFQQTTLTHSLLGIHWNLLFRRSLFSLTLTHELIFLDRVIK